MAIKIPFYDSQVGMSPEAAGALMPQPAALPMAPMQSVEEAGIPGMRLAKAGDQLLDASTVISERLNHGRAVKDFAAMDLHTRLGLDKLSNEIQQDPGAPPETWGKRYAEGAEKIKVAARSMTNNELSLASYDKMWAVQYSTRLQEITAKGNKQDAHNSGAAFEEHMPQYATLYAQATDDLSRSQINDTVTSYIQAAVKAGSITPHQGAAARMNFIPEAMKARVLQDGQRDPVGTLARLNEPEKFYPGLARDAIFPLTGTVNAQLHRVQEGNALEVQKLYESKQLTPEILKAKRDGYAINLGTWKFYDAALQADAAPVKAAQDMGLYVNELKQAMDGKLDVDKTLNELKVGKHTAPRAEHLIQINTRAAKGETSHDMAFTKDPYFRLAAREIESRLKPLEGETAQLMALKSGAKQVSPCHEAAFLFLEACKTAQKKGELDGPWMWKKVNEIIQPFERMGAFGKKPGAGGPPPAAGAAGAGGGGDIKARARKRLDDWGIPYE